MLITNHKGEYIKARRTTKGGYRLYRTSNPDDATDFVTNTIFDVLEILSEDEDNWIAIDKEEN